MLGLLRKIFGGKDQAPKVEAPYKVETPVAVVPTAEPSPIPVVEAVAEAPKVEAVAPAEKKPARKKAAPKAAPAKKEPAEKKPAAPKKPRAPKSKA